MTNLPAPTVSSSQRPSAYRLASRISAKVPTLAIASSCGRPPRGASSLPSWIRTTPNGTDSSTHRRTISR